MSEFYPSRRDALAGLLVSMAAPYVVRNSGLPMPVRDRTILSASEHEWQTILGTRDYKKYPLTFAEVKAWPGGCGEGSEAACRGRHSGQDAAAGARNDL